MMFQRSKSCSRWWVKVHQILFIERGKIVVDKPFPACRLLDPFQRYSRSKSSALLTTHKPLHLAWWNFANTCTSTTSKILLNFKFVGQRSRSHGFFGVFLCVSDNAATCRQYSALSKAWRSCCILHSLCSCQLIRSYLSDISPDLLVFEGSVTSDRPDHREVFQSPTEPDK